LFVDTMIATIESMLEAASRGALGDAPSPEAGAERAILAEKQLRLIALAIPHWRSKP